LVNYNQSCQTIVKKIGTNRSSIVYQSVISRLPIGHVNRSQIKYRPVISRLSIGCPTGVGFWRKSTTNRAASLSIGHQSVTSIGHKSVISRLSIGYQSYYWTSHESVINRVPDWRRILAEIHYQSGSQFINRSSISHVNRSQIGHK
jgi:hypothetical protein